MPLRFTFDQSYRLRKGDPVARNDPTLQIGHINAAHNVVPPLATTSGLVRDRGYDPRSKGLAAARWRPVWQLRV